MLKPLSKPLMIAALLLSTIGCGNYIKQEKLHSIFAGDPILDAKEAMTLRDYRFISVHNHDLIMPKGIPECLVDKYGHRTLSNESFNYGSYQYQQYGALSQLYANWYNYTVYESLQDEDLDQC